ncbi:hypothetical protein CIK02_20330 [Pseudomonas putida]|nr:hypothetical protein DK184_01310 [Pseudomonas sp. RW405]RIZ41903.1 hypothetical protein CIK02_20330 [Pseudomonas putida]TFF50977.1 hypothetical protein C5609_15410 [Pseudomonas putida]
MRIGLACHVLRLFHEALLVRAFLVMYRTCLKEYPFASGFARGRGSAAEGANAAFRNDNFTKRGKCRKIRGIWLA